MLSRKRVCYLASAMSAVLLLVVCTVVVGQAPPASSPAAPVPTNSPGSSGAATDAARGTQPPDNGSLTPTEALEKALADYQTAVEAELSDEALRVIQRAVLEALARCARDDAATFEKALETYKRVKEFYPTQEARDGLERIILRARGYDAPEGGSGESRNVGLRAFEYNRRSLDSASGDELTGLEPSKEQIEIAKALKEDAELERDAQQIAKQYREAEDDQAKAEFEKQLRELTERHFDLRQTRRKLQVTRLEEELKRVRDSIQKRSQAREQIIQRRISELLHREDAMAF